LAGCLKFETLPSALFSFHPFLLLKMWGLNKEIKQFNKCERWTQSRACGDTGNLQKPANDVLSWQALRTNYNFSGLFSWDSVTSSGLQTFKHFNEP
jgi:hypothetical protein